MGLLEVLATEPDLVLRLTRMLEPRDLARLESTCRFSRQMFKECRLWRQRVVEWSRRRHLGTDWLARVGPEDDLKALVGKVEGLKEQWKQGPLRIKTIDLSMLPVADLAMDETGILVGLRRGLRLYRRLDLHLLWTAACGNDVEGAGSRVSSVALTADLVLILPLPSNSAGHLWNESTCTHLLALERATGKLLFSHKLAASATAILPACKNFVLFPNLHSKHPDELTCYKVNKHCKWVILLNLHRLTSTRSLACNTICLQQ